MQSMYIFLRGRRDTVLCLEHRKAESRSKGENGKEAG